EQEKTERTETESTDFSATSVDSCYKVIPHGPFWFRFPEEARIPLAGIEACLPRLNSRAAADDAARRRDRIRRSPRIHPRRRFPIPRLEPLRPARRTSAQAVSGRRGLARLSVARLFAEHGVWPAAEVRFRPANDGRP